MALTAEQEQINVYFRFLFQNDMGDDDFIKEDANRRFGAFVTYFGIMYRTWGMDYDKSSFIRKLYTPRPTVEMFQKLLLLIAVFRLQMHNISKEGKDSIIAALDGCNDMHKITPKKWWHFGDNISYVYKSPRSGETVTTSKIMFDFMAEAELTYISGNPHRVDFSPAFIKAIDLDEDQLLWHDYGQRIKSIADFQKEADILKSIYDDGGYGRWYNQLLGKGSHQRKCLHMIAAVVILNQTTEQGAREAFYALAPYTFFTAGYSPQAIVQDFEKPSILNRLKLWLYTTSEMAEIYDLLSCQIEEIREKESQAKIADEENLSHTGGATGNPYTNDVLQRPNDSKSQQTSSSPQPKVTATPTTSSSSKPAPMKRADDTADTDNVDPHAAQRAQSFGQGNVG